MTPGNMVCLAPQVSLGGLEVDSKHMEFLIKVAIYKMKEI